MIYHISDDDDIKASFDVSTKKGKRACIKNFGLQISEPEVETLEVTPEIQKKMDKIGDLLNAKTA
ncbi:MAG: hypothetical protein Q8P62_03810 [Candidatus Peregrinibacteria bacterium]|nr:hypothetical protein [Candidatus Peregrinibacteria bacterium]